MFNTTAPISFDDGVIDLSFAERANWTGAALLMFTIGDAALGPVLMAIGSEPSGREIDVEKALEYGFVHMHRSDSFRMPVRGDFIVGRTVYAPGDFRLQESGKYYGPEGPGPVSAQGVEPSWTLLAFADRLGYRIQAANDRDLGKITAMEQPAIPLYDAVGCVPVHPDDSIGTPAIRTTLADSLHTGHADGSLAATDDWPVLGTSDATAAALGNPEAGPIFLVTRTPPSGTSTPAIAWDTEVARFVVSGSATCGDASFEPGHVRIVEAGAPQEAVIAGDQGLAEVIVIGDRRFAAPTSCADAVWSEQFGALLDRVVPVIPAVPAA
ncbi:MAG: hypothetical protein V7636_445 [Actinomycetota bacterium]|jgi:hypothetical protein